MFTSWPCWSLAISSTYLSFTWNIRCFLFFFFIIFKICLFGLVFCFCFPPRDIYELNMYLVTILTCFAGFAYPTKFSWIVVSKRSWATSLSHLLSRDWAFDSWRFAFNKSVQPILSWEDIYPFITVNTTDIFQVPSKQMLPRFSHCCCFDCFSYWQSKELLWLFVLSLSCRPWTGTACEGVLLAVRRNKYHRGPGRVWMWRQWSSLKCLAAYVGSLQVLEYSQILLG